MKLELVGGAYATRSVIGSALRCINLFPEQNRSDGAQTLTHYQRPGLRALQVPAKQGIGRGIFRASNGSAFCVIGQQVYSIGANFALSQIGALTDTRQNLVSMTDNGIAVLLVDGSQQGYSWTLANYGTFAPIVDATGIFKGGSKVAYVDTFSLWAPVVAGANLFGSTYSNELVFDPTYVAGKTGYPDPLISIYVNKREILLLGEVKSEIWYDAGNPLFPFAILPGAYIEWGCLAVNSVASTGVNVFWLAQGLQGVGLVVMQEGYNTTVVSNYALSYAIGQMAKAGADLSDAIAYTYTQDGHVFYVLTFVSGNQTWVFDASIGDPKAAWHQRCYLDQNGKYNRERAVGHAFIYGINVVQDWQNGTLYALDPDYYFDYVDDGDGNGAYARPISYVRTFPQLQQGIGPWGPVIPVAAEGRLLRIHKFVADIECGNGPLDVNGEPPSATLRVSFDRGRTYGQGTLQSTGNLGEYATSPQWRPLGLGRYPLLELSYSFAGPAALNGGWIDADLVMR